MAADTTDIQRRVYGEVRFLFQPAEEGCQGGRAVSEGGIADDVDFLLSGHIGIGLKETGKVAPACDGFLATSKIDAEFKGKSAMPEKHLMRAEMRCFRRQHLHLP